MMWDYQVVLSLAGIGAGLVGYSLYYRSIFMGVTKPHLFSWLTYVLIDSIAFVGALVKGAGPGAWPVFLGVVANTGLTLLALRWGEKNILKSDWISFAGALLSIVLWVVTSDPLIAVAIASLINAFAIYPTFRKSIINPHQESITIWSWDLLRFSLSIAALSAFNPTTILFPASSIFFNSILVTLILFRRKALAVNGSVR